jgi:hypothetical protein
MNNFFLPLFPLMMVMFMLLFWDDEPMTELDIDNKIIASFDNIKVNRNDFSNYSELISQNKKHENITVSVSTYSKRRDFKDIYIASENIIFSENNNLEINVSVFKKKVLFKYFQVNANYSIQGNVLNLTNLSGDLFLLSDSKTMLIDKISEGLLITRAWNKDVSMSYSRENK